MADDPKAPKPASVLTAAANAALLEALPFSDRKDFESATRGKLAELPDGIVTNDDGAVLWDLGRWNFLEGDAPPEVNPSLWRQAQLNQIHGLFEVTDGIYQFRGYDLSVMTFVRGERGWIVVDPLISQVSAKRGLELVNKTLGTRPVTAMLYTHSHIDHYGGAIGIISPEDASSGRIPVLAPEEFTEEAVSENMIAGNHMRRRAMYMYGPLLPPDPKGHVDAGLGRTTAPAPGPLIPPNDIIRETGEERILDGVKFIFQVAPGAEAPVEFIFDLPEKKALCMAEIATHVMHNVYTPRGAQVRDALLWSKHIDDSIRFFGAETEVLFASHHWPTWGNADLIGFLELQRDAYKYIHDQTLRLANHGYNMVEAAEMVQLPDSLGKVWANRDYYGTVNHNVKATWQRYFGWFDGNPANLHPLPPEEAATRYVDFMGGAAAVLERAAASFDNGEYRWVAEVVRHVVFDDPENEAARFLLADAMEQMGYQAESGPWRNFYLTGAMELRQMPDYGDVRAQSGAQFQGLSLELLFDTLSVLVNGPKADGLDLALNIEFTDTDECARIWIENAVLHYRIGSDDGGTVTITGTRRVIMDLLLENASSSESDIEVEGDQSVLTAFIGLLDHFPFWFNIVVP